MKELDEILSLINKEMDFYSYEDFYNNAKELKNMYHKYCDNNYRTQKLYCWYVYSRDIKYSQKNRIWEFLNNDISLGDLMKYEQDKSKYTRKDLGRK